MNKTWAVPLFIAFAGHASAQMTPVGLWRSIDDQSGKAKAEIRIMGGCSGNQR